MALLFALIAIVLAAACCVLAARAWRRSHHLALEMIDLRARLARAERTQREDERRSQADAEVSNARAGDVEDARLRDLESRVDDLRGQLAHAVEANESLAARAEALEHPTDDERDETLDVRDLVRRGLRRQGYRRVRVTAPNKVLVEAERNGIMAKGTAWVDAEGHVVLRSQSTLRAFP